MRPPLRFRYSVATLLLAAACGSPVAPDASDLRVQLGVDRVRLEPGDTGVVSLVLTNTGWSEIVLTGSSSCPPFGFEIRDATGTVVHDPLDLSGRICTADARTWRIGARSSLVREIRWSGHTWSQPGFGRLPAGEYVLTGVALTPPDQRIRGEPLWLEVR